MNTISIETLAEKLGGNLWIKENLKRIYLDRGYNTKKMSTKTYVYQREDGSFGVSCKIDCPSQAWQWIESQEKEIIARVEKSIEKAFFKIENPGVDYDEHLENEKNKQELKEFEANINSFIESTKNDYARAVKYKEIYDQELETFSNLDDASKLKIEELNAERESILGTPGSAKRSGEIKKEIASFPSKPLDMNDWIKKAITFSTAEEYADFEIEEKRKSFNVNPEIKIKEEAKPAEITDEWEAIHISYLKNLIGKTITWKAPAYRTNSTYEGVAKIISVDVDDRRPVKSETISGNNLDYAFVNDGEGLLCYSDDDRFVTYKFVDHD